MPRSEEYTFSTNGDVILQFCPYWCKRSSHFIISRRRQRFKKLPVCVRKFKSARQLKVYNLIYGYKDTRNDLILWPRQKSDLRILDISKQQQQCSKQILYSDLKI